jgi:hypothetical protein
LEYLGTTSPNKTPVWGYKYRATSDDYVLNLNPIGIIPPFINTTSGAIIEALINKLAPGLFDTTNIGTGQKIARYKVDPRKKFYEIVKELANSARHKFYIKDHDAYFVQQDALTGVTLDGNNKHFTPSRLDIRPTQDPIVNDVLVIGDIEPQAYVNEYFLGDSLTSRYPLISSVYGVDRSIILDDTMTGSNIDPNKWTEVDTVNDWIQLDSGYLNVLGGNATDDLDVYLTSAKLVPLEGALRITHGEWDFLDLGSTTVTGVIGGLWTNVPAMASATSYPNCVYGIRVTRSGGIQLKPILAGSTQTESLTIDTTKRYIMRTVVSSQSPIRMSQEYAGIDETGTVVRYGGDGIASPMTFETLIVTINPADGTVVGKTRWLHTTTISADNLYAFYTPVASNDLHCTVANITVSVPMQVSLGMLKNYRENTDYTVGTYVWPTTSNGHYYQVTVAGTSGVEPTWPTTSGATVTSGGVTLKEVGTAPKFNLQLIGPNEIDSYDGQAPVATISDANSGVTTRSSLLGSPQYNPGNAALQFFKDSVRQVSDMPQVKDMIRLTYRRPGAAMARIQKQTSITTEAALWGDSGLRSLTRSDLNPMPRTSEECEMAAAALVTDNSYTHYEGSYSQFSEYFSAEPVSGAIFAFANLPDGMPTVQAEEIREVRTVFECDNPQEWFFHQVSFGRSQKVEKALNRLSTQREVFQPQDTVELPAEIDINDIGTTFAVDVPNVELTSWDTTNLYFSTNQTAPASGGFEVRYTDAGWGTNDGKNLVGRFTGSTFSAPRNPRSRVIFVRAYDSAGNYSRYPCLVHVAFPLIPQAPTAVATYDQTTGYPALDITLPSVMQDVWGIEIRADSGVVAVGTSGPWLFTGGINASYPYGDATPTTTTVVPGTLITGDLVDIRWVSGTVATDVGYSAVGPSGDLAYSGSPFDNTYPAWYMDNNAVLGEVGLCGAFTDSSGVVVLPFIIGYGRTIQVPAGATQLQLGINEDELENNIGSYNVLVRVNDVLVASGSETVLEHIDLIDPEYSSHWIQKTLPRPNGYYTVYTYNLLGEYSSAYQAEAVAVIPTVSDLAVDDETKILLWNGQGFGYRVEISANSVYDPLTFNNTTKDKFLQLLDPDFFPFRYIKVTAYDTLGDGGYQEITHDYESDPPVIVPEPVDTTISASVFLNGWAGGTHVGDYENGGGAYAHSHPLGTGDGGGTTLAYVNASAAIDTSDTTPCYKEVQHSHQYAGCIWKFSSAATSLDGLTLRVLSEVKAPIITGRSAGVWYSLDNQTTWVKLYETPNDTRRAKQWDSVSLPDGQNPNHVYVMAFLDSHDNMGHYIYSVKLELPASGTGAN